MQLLFSDRTQEIIDIEDRLKVLTLAYKAIIDHEVNEPSFIDGSKEYRGIVKMNNYLDQLEREKEQWYYCNC